LNNSIAAEIFAQRTHWICYSALWNCCSSTV